LTTGIQQRLGGALLAGATVLLLIAIARWVLMPAPDFAGRIPNAAELDSLQGYLARSPALPAWLDETRFAIGGSAESARSGPNPWREPPAPEEIAADAGAVPGREFALTAILHARDRSIAVIDDRQVGPGDVLPGGVRVARIATDRVVLRAPDGSEQVIMLRVEGGEE
jgi:hypothetical protein